MHEDKYNPHAGVLDAIGHFCEWRGGPIGVAGLDAGACELVFFGSKMTTSAWANSNLNTLEDIPKESRNAKRVETGVGHVRSIRRRQNRERAKKMSGEKEKR